MFCNNICSCNAKCVFNIAFKAVLKKKTVSAVTFFFILALFPHSSVFFSCLLFDNRLLNSITKMENKPCLPQTLVEFVTKFTECWIRWHLVNKTWVCLITTSTQINWYTTDLEILINKNKMIFLACDWLSEVTMALSCLQSSMNIHLISEWSLFL